MQNRLRGASQEAIQHHYDVGNAFYRAWLDDTLTYSGAMWGKSTTLEEAQLRKLDYHATQSQAPGSNRVLDIGCGWGSMLTRLVSAHDVQHAVGLTLSQEQATWIRQQNLQGIECRVESWVDHSPGTPYDAIISIGALEHFARIDRPVPEKIANYRHFFRRCHEWLRPGGRLSVQAIAYGNLLREDISGGFVATEIFPESDFVRLAELVEASEFLFEIELLRNDPEDYELTCQAWLSRLRRNRAAAVAAVGPELTDKWEQYLDLSVRGWKMRATNLLRITFRRIDQPRRPPQPNES